MYDSAVGTCFGIRILGLTWCVRLGCMITYSYESIRCEDTGFIQSKRSFPVSFYGLTVFYVIYGLPTSYIF